MDFSLMPVWLVFATSLLLALSVMVYGRLLARLRAGHGRVVTAEYTPLDGGVAAAMATFFVHTVFLAVGGGRGPVDMGRLWSAALMYLAGVALIAALLIFRHISVAQQFGLRRIRVRHAVGLGAVLLLAAYPLLLLASVVTQALLGADTPPQEIVEYFRNAVNRADSAARNLVIVLAIAVAPAAEEFIFRGYLYGVLKRFAGMGPALVLVSILFAAIHANLAAAAPLFLLALALNIAYEVSGSLLVPVAMHALFNASQLVLMFLLDHPAS